MSKSKHPHGVTCLALDPIGTLLLLHQNTCSIMHYIFLGTPLRSYLSVDSHVMLNWSYGGKLVSRKLQWGVILQVASVKMKTCVCACVHASWVSVCNRVCYMYAKSERCSQAQAAQMCGYRSRFAAEYWQPILIHRGLK